MGFAVFDELFSGELCSCYCDGLWLGMSGAMGLVDDWKVEGVGHGVSRWVSR